MVDQEFLVALGANQPFEDAAPQETLTRALAEIETANIQVIAFSRFFNCPSFPKGAGPDYVNSAVVLRSDLSPHRMLTHLHDVEATFARRRKTRWASRTLDLDLLACGESVLPDVKTWQRWYALSPERQRTDAPEQLILPHPRLSERAFVLVPLAEIAPQWRHPILQLTVLEMRDLLPAAARAEVIALQNPPKAAK